MRKTRLLQVRLPERIVREVDKLIELGLFRSRGEVVAEALRRLIMDYSSLADDLSGVIELYLSGRLERDLKPKTRVEIDFEEARRRILDFFGTDDVDEVLEAVRRRRVGGR